MAKAGEDYEQIVGAVQRALDPGSHVEVGIWVEGPDGRRDMDVAVRGTKEGRPHLTLIECKDWRTPVGISVIDALDSKRRDLGANAAIVFGNSGFTDDAARKAARVQISLAGALKAGDPRIRVQVWREFIARRRAVDRWSMTVFWSRNQEDPGDFVPHNVFFDGKPVVNWISQESSRLLQELPDVPERSEIRAEYAFRTEVAFEIGGRAVFLKGIALRLECSGGYVRQTVREDVSLGYYDFLRRRVTVPGQQSYILGPFDNAAWQDADMPPAEGELEPGTFRLDLTLLRPVVPVLGAGVPTIDDVIVERAFTIGSGSA